MKKIIVYGITLFLVAMATIAGTYAYFAAVVENRQAVDTGTHQLQVIYYGDEPIEGEIELVRNKDEGLRRELKIGLDEGSLLASANFYLHAEYIDEPLATSGFKWEFYEMIDSKEVYIDSGTLEGLTSGNKIYFKEELVLNNNEMRNFVVYLWINGYEVGNEVKGTELIGYLGAETMPITGNMS